MSQVFSTLVLCLNLLLTEYKHSRCFFPSLKIHSLWQAINGHKESENNVSRLRDLSSVSMLDTRTGQTDLLHFLRAKEIMNTSAGVLRPTFWSYLLLDGRGAEKNQQIFGGVIALFQSFGSLQKKLRYSMRFILEMRVGQQSSILLLFELPAKMLRQRSTNMSWALLN